MRSPWMSESVKISAKISRRDILLLSQLLERGLASEDAKSIIPSDAVDGLRAFAAEFLLMAEVPDEFSQSFRELISGTAGK